MSMNESEPPDAASATSWLTAPRPTPSDISVLDIVEAAEEPATFDRCVLRHGHCVWEQTGL
jgi:hypothetical protein